MVKIGVRLKKLSQN